MVVRVRPMRREEVNAVLNIIHKSIHELNSKDYTPSEIKAISRTYNKYVLTTGDVPIVVEKESKIIGIAQVSSFGYKTQVIQALFVHPDFIRQGIGRTLVQDLEQRAKDRNVKRIRVTASLTAVEFYQALGYEYIRQENIGFSPADIRCALFKKQLAPFTATDWILSTLFIVLTTLFGVFIFILYYW